MPIKPERRALYHPNWKTIALVLKERAGWKCELCPAEQGKPHWKTGSKVVLTVHHITHDPTDNRPFNLIVLCQRCHLRLDRAWRISHPIQIGEKLFQDYILPALAKQVKELPRWIPPNFP